MACGLPFTCPVLDDSQLYALEDPPNAQLNCQTGGAPIPPPTTPPPPPQVPINATTVTISACGQIFTASIAGMTFQQQINVINTLLAEATTAIVFCGGRFTLTYSGQTEPMQFFGNQPVTATITCSSNNTFTTNVPACSIIANSQSAADALAKAQAQNTIKTPICLNPIPTCLCVGTQYSGTVSQQGMPIKLTWTTSGVVPPGLTVHTGMSSTLTIDGTPVSPGTFGFQVIGTASDGSFATLNITMSVLQVTTTQLPGLALNTPYNFQMVAIGGSGNYQWQVTGGALPTGLSLNTSGLISGTPTDLGVQPVVITVSDLTCEVPPPVPVIPRASLAAVSTTKVATVNGYSEFPGFVSSPPKKFHTLTWSGTSEQQLWYKNVQIGGARYTFSGTDSIDTAGNIISNHGKELSVMCNGAQNRAAIIGGVNSDFPAYNNACSFLGYYGTNSTFIQPPCLIEATTLCMAPSNPYMDVGNIAVPTPLSSPSTDLNGLWGSASLGFGEQTSFIGNASVVPTSNTSSGSNDNGTSNVFFTPYCIPLLQGGAVGPVTIGIYLEEFSTLATPCGAVPRPPDWNAQAQVIFTNNFQANLSDEYTDAEALTNAITITGNSTIAQNLFRTTGFESTFTSVQFTVTCTNLLKGKTYNVQVTFQDLTSGVPTTKNYTLVAQGSIGTITDTIPQPLTGHQVQVIHPKVSQA